MRQAFFALLAFVFGGLVAIAALALGLLDWIAPTGGAATWGQFPTLPMLKAMPDGRTFQMLENFVYIDPRKKVWVCPKDAFVDGASIPQPFWSIVGGPMEGQFRNASIVHDEACKRRTETWQSVHQMFYEACRCGGLPENRAKLLFAAVYHFGPHWELETLQETKVFSDRTGKTSEIIIERSAGRETTMPPEPEAEVGKKLEKYINERNPSVEDLMKLDLNSL